MNEAPKIRVDSTAGLGAAIDLGVSYDLTDNITLSASVLDLGFISYGKGSSHNAVARGSLEFDGFDLPLGSYANTPSLGSQISSLKGEAKELAKFRTGTPSARTVVLAPKVLVGGEYTLDCGHLGFGLLSSTAFYPSGVFTELTVSANYQPLDWLGASVSYSMIHGRNAVGVALNYSPRRFNLFIGTDYMHFRNTPQAFPIHGLGFNFNMGMSVMLGNLFQPPR